MKHLIHFFLCVFGLTSMLHAQTNLFTPTSPITPFGSVSSPAGEQFPNIRDGSVATKFLDFNRGDGMGFTVNIGTPIAATRLTMTTANDAIERDPTSFSILGSNDNVTFTPIATVAIPCIATRFFARDFSFANTTAYQYYRIIYNNPCDSPFFANSIQVAETQISYPVGNVSISLNGTCTGTSDDFTLTFDVASGTGDYEIVATSANVALGINIGDVLGTLTGAVTDGTGLTITGSIPSDITPATSINVNVKDANVGGDAPIANIQTVSLPECIAYPINNVAIVVDGNCIPTGDEFTLSFDVTGGSGDYEVIAASAIPASGINIGDVLGSVTGAATDGIGLTITGNTFADITPATTLDVNIQDANVVGAPLVGNVVTVNLPECFTSNVPTLSEWGLIIFTLLLLNLSILFLKTNRKKTVSLGR